MFTVYNPLSDIVIMPSKKVVRGMGFRECDEGVP